MAAASPALSNNSTDTSSVAASIVGNSLNNISGGNNSSKNQRGLNKPKCIKCGNVARSRCPYQSCKNCCAKAENPCHIHVLKGASSLPDKVQSSGSPSSEQQPTENSSSPSVRNSFRVSSFRHLSNNFAQFNNLQSPLRSRKPLTKKEAVVINDWRFLKLKEYRDRNIEVENDAFDRYMQNVCLLEEVFASSSALGEPKKYAPPVSPNSEQNHEKVSSPDPNSEQNNEMIVSPNPNFEQGHEMIPNSSPKSEQKNEMIPNTNPDSEQNAESISHPDPNSEQNLKVISWLKLQLRSDPERIEISRKRAKYIVDQGLKKLEKLDTPNVVHDLSDEAELIKRPKRAKYSRLERLVALNDLTEKLTKARCKEDLNSCREIKARAFDTHNNASEGVSGDIETLEQQEGEKEDSHKRHPEHSMSKWFSTVAVDKEDISRIDAHFSSLEEIEDL